MTGLAAGAMDTDEPPGCDNLSQWRQAFSCLKSNRCMTRFQ